MDVNIHHIIIFIVILVILFLQIRQYNKSQATIKAIRGIFPFRTADSFVLDTIHSYDEENKVDREWYEIKARDKSDNKTRQEILDSINNYLQSNGANASDFYLIKDIVERNCGMREDELQTHTPTPLYLGLMGTMMGILVGVGFLLLSGSLDSLLGADNGSGADGIKALLSGVALAMVCSIMGLIFTTRLTILGQDARSECDNRKNSFLSWVQTQLLPKMTSDAGSVIRMMTTKLTKFNQDFSENAKVLDVALAGIRGTAQQQSQLIQQQTQLLDAIRSLNVTSLAGANIEVYSKLKDCVTELGDFAQAAHECSSFTSEMKAFVEETKVVSQKLADADDRVRAIEEMAKFFKKWERELDSTKNIANKAVDDASVAMQDACNSLESSIENSINKLSERNTEQIDIWEKALQSLNERMCSVIKQVEADSNDQMVALRSSIDTENEAIKERAGEMGRMADQIANLAGLTSTFENLNKTLESQNERSEKIANSLTAMTGSLKEIAQNSKRQSSTYAQKTTGAIKASGNGNKDVTAPKKKGFADTLKNFWAGISQRFNHPKTEQVEQEKKDNGES